MSHTTTIKSIKITDTNALIKAAEELKASGVNVELLQNAVPRMYYNNQVGTCDYVLNLKGTSYDVGFQRQSDGSYVPVFDEYRNYVGSQLAAACPMPTTAEGKVQHQIGKFTQLYAKHAAINAAVASGYQYADAYYDDQHNLILEAY